MLRSKTTFCLRTLLALATTAGCTSNTPESTAEPSEPPTSPAPDPQPDAEPELPVVDLRASGTFAYDTSEIALYDSEDAASAPYRWERYRNENPDYRCTMPDSGNQIFTVYSPAGSADTDPMPMIVSLPGGAGGWWVQPEHELDWAYDEAENAPGGTWNFTAESLARQEAFDTEEQAFMKMPGLFGLLRDNAATTPFRIVRVSHCQQDMHFGLGQPDVGAHPEDTPPVTGLLAVLAALDYSTAHYETTKVVMHGVSAGAIAMSGVSYAHAELGEPFPIAGYVIDSAAHGPNWPDICEMRTGNGVRFCDHEARAPRLGPLYTDDTTWLTTRVASGEEQTPLYFMYDHFDTACHRGAAPVTEGYGPDGTLTRCQLMMKPLEDAVREHNPGGASHAFALCVGEGCSHHGITITDDPNTDEAGPAEPNVHLFAWLQERVAP